MIFSILDKINNWRKTGSWFETPKCLLCGDLLDISDWYWFSDSIFSETCYCRNEKCQFNSQNSVFYTWDVKDKEIKICTSDRNIRHNYLAWWRWDICSKYLIIWSYNDTMYYDIIHNVATTDQVIKIIDKYKKLQCFV